VWFLERNKGTGTKNDQEKNNFFEVHRLEINVGGVEICDMCFTALRGDETGLPTNKWPTLENTAMIMQPCLVFE
jgi:hypothetical protein